MGISGLLQFLKDASEPVNVKKYKGQTVAVDTYCWLHKGAFSCAEKLAKGEPTEQYVWFCMKFVDMLLNFGVKPILVFDGRNLPSKREVEKSRRERRELNLQKGRQLLREGKVSEARDCFNRCVNITPAMAHNLIKVARSRGVDCLVAPYEADAQLAFLSKNGLAQAVITEDSDLLAFGCKNVILKMDKQGNGLEIDQSHLGRVKCLGNVFTEEKFRYMCILSGCDYLPSLHGIGLGKACKLLRLARDPDILKVIKKMGQYLKMDLVVPDSYLEGFVRANNTFLYQLVFDPRSRRVVPLNPYDDKVRPEELNYAGINIGEDKALQMALGNLDLNTLEKIDDFCPDKPQTQVSKPRSRSWNDSPSSLSSSSSCSIWSRADSTAPPTAPSSPPAEPRASTKGQHRVVSVAPLKLFFSSSTPASAPSAASDAAVSDSEAPEAPSVETPSFSPPASPQDEITDSSPSAPPPNSEKTDTSLPNTDTPEPAVSPSSSRGLQLFHWSGSAQTEPQSSSGLSALKRFKFKKENCTNTHSPVKHRAADSEELDDSPQSQDSAYFSQSQTCSSSSPSDTKENLCSSVIDLEQNSPTDKHKPCPPVYKAAGLSRPNSTQTHKPRAPGPGLGPARVSGLKRKSGLTKPSVTNENSPGVQATISGLWKNFGFKKDSPKICCKEPLSPVKDNTIVLS
ncbi:hypothetical protein WMY93_018498 [Mugilogobius chulae]|uniref:Exonuclease 1 n=1 Tax=Mugilogobius chulae TaxID=88201 RepID=A0AAW0NNA3_9GOBI